MGWKGQTPSAPWAGCSNRLLTCPVQVWGGTQQSQLASWHGHGPGSAMMPGRRAERALPGSAVLAEQPPGSFLSVLDDVAGAGLEQLWSSSGAGRSGCETQALHLLCRAGTGQGRAGSHRRFRGCRAPSRRSCLGKAGRRLEEGWKKAAGPAGSVTAWGGLPPHSPYPSAGSSPSQCAGAQGKGWGMCAGWGAHVPTAGLARK